MSDEKWMTCKCQHCDGKLEFETHNAGLTVPCPHCKKDTVLNVRTTSPLSATQTGAWLPQPKENLVEDRIDDLAKAVVAIAILAAIVCLWVAFGSTDVETGTRFAWFGYAIAAAVAGFIWRIVFKGFAEIVRLLRRIAEK